jgi:hypothetical protein
LQVKAGIAATTGTQTTPAADAGWTGLFVVTVANDATTITSGSATFLISTLQRVPYNVQNGGWTYGVDTGTADNFVVTLRPIPSAIVAGMKVTVKMLNAPTGASVINFNGLGNQAIDKTGGAPLVGQEWAAGHLVSIAFDGTNWQVQQTNQRPTLTANKTIFVNGSIGTTPMAAFRMLPATP